MMYNYECDTRYIGNENVRISNRIESFSNSIGYDLEEKVNFFPKFVLEK